MTGPVPRRAGMRDRVGRLWRYARPYRGDFAAGFGLLLGTNALALGIPWLLREAVAAMEAGTDLSTLSAFAAGMVGLALAQAWVRTRSRLRTLGASRRVAHDLRRVFFAHLQRLDAPFYDGQRTGDVMSRAVNDVQILQSLYGPGVMNLLNTAIVYVAVTGVLLWLDPVLALLSLALLPALYLGVNRISRRVYARSLAVQEQIGVLSNRVQENLSGIRQVKIYAQEEGEIARFRRMCEEYRLRNLSLARLRGTMMALIGVFSGCATLLVLFAGGLRVIGGALSFADFVAFQAYLAQLAWPTVALGWIVNVFQRGAGALDRIEEILETRPSVPAAGPPASSPPPREAPEIRVRGLTFSYRTGPAAAPALRDVSLDIPPGSRLALVGPVGSGKSTLVHLLARVYPAPSAAIFVGGTDLAEIPVEVHRRRVALVSQDPFLFSRTLRENLALARPGATDEEVLRAVRAAGFEEDLASLPSGLDTWIGERGVTLSGGQRQRATIARALLADAPVVILDDALSSVDSDTERTVLSGLDEAARGRTLLFVTHRPSTLAAVDRIVVLEEGRLVEEGSHRELLERGGVYAALFRRHELEARLDES